jgi:hypothetical protein
MPNDDERGTEVAGDEALLRGIVRPEWWNAEEQRPSTAIFSFPKFSAYQETITPDTHPIRRLPAGSDQFPDGSGVLRINCNAARLLGFDARHEPENGDEAHANVYCDLNSTQRKKRIRRLLDPVETPSTSVLVTPVIERLLASTKTKSNL